MVQDKPRFAQCFNRLAVALRLAADEADVAMQRVYWDALAAMPIEAVEDAARQLSLSAQWFPKTSEWLSVAEQARSTRALAAALPHPRESPWQSECETCDDTGWETLSCDGGDQCGKSKQHAKHAYVIRCVCRHTNHTYQRKVEEQRRIARQKATARTE